MSSIMACRLPPPSPCPSGSGTGRGVLSSEVRPIDWASRRAGSTVSTTTCLPRSAARSPSAAAVVVLPTPPEPQQTMMRVRGSSSSRSTSSRFGRSSTSPSVPEALSCGGMAYAAPCSRRALASRYSPARSIPSVISGSS